MNDQNKPEETIEQIEERLAKKRDDRAKVERDQRRIDLLAREQLEDEYPALCEVRVARHVAGHPTMAILRTPNSSEYKRFRDQAARGASSKNVKSTNDASDLLARACWVYPANKEVQDAMLEAYPGLLVSITIAAQKLAEGNAVEEGKG